MKGVFYMKVVYPVLFYEEEDGGYSIFVPDLDNASTCGDTLEDAMYMAQDLIAGILLDEMEEGNKLPKASNINQVNYKNLEDFLDIKDWNYKSKFKTYIAVDLSLFAEKWNKKLVKKTVNIPMWVNSKAEELNINFSKTLEEALLEKIYK
jgi:predicted RNase H-like HicB family nuclease